MVDQRVATGSQVVVADDRDGTVAYASVTVFLALAVFLISCSLPSPQPPKRELPAGEHGAGDVKVTRNDEITLLPDADGSVGSLVVRQDGVEIVLDKPYASVIIEGPGQVRQLSRDPELTKAKFSATLAALPPKPASFLLYFLPGKDEFTAESKKEIKNMLAELAKRQAAEISVIGHTDTVGSVQFNDKLSLRRASRARQLLVDRGIPRDSISIAGRGERELLFATKDDVDEPRNRRVEVNIK
ncbi:MAG TPA: OmpA family protein [Burkholderiales bacterium]|nr:OmpA family protein [Burkholderiales bacterium]